MRFAYDGSAACSAPRSTLSRTLGLLLGATMAAPRLWARRRYDRRALLQLDDHLLRDIGLDRMQVKDMAARPFWRA